MTNEILIITNILTNINSTLVTKVSSIFANSNFNNILNIGIIFLITGIFGGTVNIFLFFSEEDLKNINLSRRIDKIFSFLVSGIAASFCVPLFLTTISSNIIEEISSNPNKILILIGFGLIASIYSKNFLMIISNKILKDKIEENRNQLNEAQEELKSVMETNRELTTEKMRSPDNSQSINKILSNIDNTIPDEQNGVYVKIIEEFIYTRFKSRTDYGILSNIQKFDNLKNIQIIDVQNILNKYKDIKLLTSDKPKNETYWKLTEYGRKLFKDFL